MGKISLDFNFLNENGDVIGTVIFQSIKEIDEVIEKLQEARAEFEHRIEMKRQKSREKRKRRREKPGAESGNYINEMEDSYQKLMDAYNKMPEFFKVLFKPATDAITELVGAARKENEK